MKRKLSLILASLFLFSAIAGCSNGQSGSGTGGGDSTGGGSGDGTTYTLKLGHDHTTTSPFHVCALEFEQAVEEASGGRIQVEVYPAQQLGTAREMIEMMQMGTLEATLLPTSKFGGFDERLNLADMPYLCETEEDFLALFNGEIGQEAMSTLPDIGIKGMAYFPEGFKYITNNSHPITSPDDLKGMKIRTMEAPIIMSMFKCWGANPVPIDFSELYNSLQQKVVDGQENPLLSIHDMKFYEVQKYMTIDSHAYLSYFLSFSNSWFESLPEDLQQVVTDASMDAAERCHELMVEANEGYLQTIVDYGVEVYTLTDEEAEAFKVACEPLYDEYRDTFGGDLLDRAVAESARIAEERKAAEG